MYKKRDVAETLTLLMRHDGDISQGALERVSGVHQPTINRILTRNSIEPKRPTLEKLAAYFRVTVDQLRGEEPIPWLDSGAEQQNVEDLVEEVATPYIVKLEKENRLITAIKQLSDQEQDALLTLLNSIIRNRR